MNYTSKQLKDFVLDLSPSYQKEIESIIEEKNPKNRSETDYILAEFRKQKKFMKVGKFTKQYWIQRGWSENEADIKKSKKIKSKSGTPMQMKFWLNKINPKTKEKYTHEEAEYKIKSQRKLNIEYWVERGYDLEGAREKVSITQTGNSEKMKKSLVDFPERYKARTWTQVLYWVDKGLTVEEAKNKISDLQKMNDINTLIKKYGDIDGRKKYEEIIKKVSYGSSLEYQIQNYGEAEGNRRYRKYIESITKFYRGTSKESILFFIPLYKKIRNYLQRSEIYWGIDGSNEYFLWDTNLSRIFFYDFCIPKHKIIIEFHGIRWHPNPRWEKDKLKKWNLYGINYIDKMKIDNYKKELAEKNGFKVFEIYSDEKKYFNFDLILDIIS